MSKTRSLLSPSPATLGALAAAAAVFVAPVQAQAQVFDPLETVEYVDLERYTGEWYEIATIPAVFQWGCTGTIAEYTQRDDGDIDVVNTCNMFWLRGPERDAVGVASVVDTQTNAKLEVRFNGSPAAGAYWVIGLDDEDYQWAVVGEPSRSYFWILSRTPQMDDDLYDSLIDDAEVQGYDVTEIVKSKQPLR